MSPDPICLPTVKTPCPYQRPLPPPGKLRLYQPRECRLHLLLSPQSPEIGNILWLPTQLSQEGWAKALCAGNPLRHLRLSSSLIHFSFSPRLLLNRKGRQVLMDSRMPDQVHQPLLG